MGSAYFKSSNDKHHLKIHKMLIYVIISTIFFFLMFVILSVATKINVQSIVIKIIAINILASYGLFFNSLGEGNVIDFMINGCTKVKSLIIKIMILPFV